MIISFFIELFWTISGFSFYCLGCWSWNKSCGFFIIFNNLWFLITLSLKSINNLNWSFSCLGYKTIKIWWIRCFNTSWPICGIYMRISNTINNWKKKNKLWSWISCSKFKISIKNFNAIGKETCIAQKFFQKNANHKILNFFHNGKKQCSGTGTFKVFAQW